MFSKNTSDLIDRAGFKNDFQDDLISFSVEVVNRVSSFCDVVVVIDGTEKFHEKQLNWEVNLEEYEELELENCFESIAFFSIL